MSGMKLETTLANLDSLIEGVELLRSELIQWQGGNAGGFTSEEEVDSRIVCRDLTRLLTAMAFRICEDREDALARAYFGGTESYDADLSLMNAIQNPKIKSRIALDMADGLVHMAEEFQHDYPEAGA